MRPCDRCGKDVHDAEGDGTAMCVECELALLRDNAVVSETLADLVAERKTLRAELECWKACAATNEDGTYHPLPMREAVRMLDIEKCRAEAKRGHDFVKSLQDDLAKATAPIPGVTDGTGPYTLDEVMRIEQVRGKEYARLRATVAERDGLKLAFEMLRRDLIAEAEKRAALAKELRRLLDSFAGTVTEQFTARAEARRVLEEVK